MRRFNYDQKTDEFVENQRERDDITGNRVFVTGEGSEQRFKVEIDDFGYVLAAFDRLVQRLIPTFVFPQTRKP